MSASKYGPTIPQTWNVLRQGSPKGRNRETRQREAREFRLMLKEAYAIDALRDRRAMCS